MRDNVNDEEKEWLKNDDNKQKKEKYDNLDECEKDQLRKYAKKQKIYAQ